MPGLDRHGAEPLIQVLTEREEKASIAIASNESFASWTRTFTDPRLCAPSLIASPSGGAGRVVPPHVRFDGVSGGDTLGQGWFLNLSSATGPDRCAPSGRSGKVLLALGDGPPQTCTVEQGTTVFVIGLTAFCDSASPPQPRTRAAQIKCAWKFLEDEVMVESVEFTINGGPALELRRQKFETCSPQRHVQLPPGNIIGVKPQRATFTACGWVAWLADLPAGQHRLRSVATDAAGEEIHVWEPTINVRPKTR